MRIRFSAAGVLALATLAACSDEAPTNAGMSPVQSPAMAAAPAQDEVVPGEVLVKFKDGVDATDLLRANGLVRRAVGYKGSFEVLNGARGQERALAAVLKNDPSVEWAEPNYIRRVEAIDSRLWAFFNPGGLNMNFSDPADSRYGTPIPSSYASVADADEDAIEGIGVGGSEVVISNIDTGVDFSHPEFAGRLIRGCDWYSQAASGNGSGTCSDFSSDDTSDQGHGTHTAGTSAGATVGVTGVTGATNVKVFVQRVCGANGCYTSSIINAIRAAADQPNMVAMNLSLGGRTISTGEKNAIAYATNKGVLVIAAAGNSGTNRVACPACDPNAISVAATNWKDELTSYSQYGSGLDISAPGGMCYSNTTEEGCIFSAIVAGYQATQGYKEYNGPLAGGKYAYMNGTSMATPQVTGAAAVVASKTGLRGAALRARLESTAFDLGVAGYDTKFGNGRLNVYRAVTGNTLAGGL
jgi:subtilisin family serine protease